MWTWWNWAVGSPPTRVWTSGQEEILAAGKRERSDEKRSSWFILSASLIAGGNVLFIGNISISLTWKAFLTSDFIQNHSASITSQILMDCCMLRALLQPTWTHSGQFESWMHPSANNAFQWVQICKQNIRWRNYFHKQRAFVGEETWMFCTSLMFAPFCLVCPIM